MKSGPQVVFNGVPKGSVPGLLFCDLLIFVKDFQGNQSFCLKVGTTKSGSSEVISEVSQGSVQDPLLFLLYILPTKEPK